MQSLPKASFGKAWAMTETDLTSPGLFQKCHHAVFGTLLAHHEQLELLATDQGPSVSLQCRGKVGLVQLLVNHLTRSWTKSNELVMLLGTGSPFPQHLVCHPC